MTVRAVELPQLWMPYPLRVNPYLSALREESETWAREMGMLGGEGPSARGAIWTRSQFHAMTVELLTAWTLPDASLAGLRLNHRFNIWALAWDDYFASTFKQTGDLPGALDFTARLHAFLRPEADARSPEPVNAVERGIADLQKHLFPPRLAHWRQEFNLALAHYIDAGVQELTNSRGGRVPHLIEYAPFRRESFAAHTAPYSVELATGARIPEQLRHTRTVHALLDAFMDVMGLANDVASYEREVHEERDVNNLVVVIGTSLGITLHQAVPAALHMVNARMRDFEHLPGVRREGWTVDRFGGAVAYRDAQDHVHVVWTGVPTSDLTTLAARTPATMRVQDGWRASWALSKPAAAWELQLFDPHSWEPVRSFAGGETRGRVDVVWDGRTAAGKPVPNGSYTWRLRANTADGKGADLLVAGSVSVSGGRPVWRDLAGNDMQGELLALDTTGGVSMYRGDGFGGLSGRMTATGAKFATSTVLVPFGDVNADGCADVLARVGDQLRAYRPGCGKVVTASSPYTLLGSGWGQYDVLTSPGDANGDGFIDLIVRQTTTGDMYFYAGTADHRLAPRVRIGVNWKLYKKIVGVGDLNRDGRGDLLGVDAAGVLWRYYGTATGGVTPRVRVGGGWGGYSALAGVGDISGDGCADLVARDTTGKLYGYPATCAGAYQSRVLIGSGGWNTFKALF